MKSNGIKIVPVAALAAALAGGCATAPYCEKALNTGTPNTLSAEEKAEGWELLWDGRGEPAFVGLKNGGKAFPTKGWKIANGELSMTPSVRLDENGNWVELPKEEAALGGGGDVYTKERFRDFAFKVDFKLTKAANSGIKYFFEPDVNVGTTMEYQLLDPAHPDWLRGRDGNRRVASVYDLIPGKADAYLKPTGEWNTAMIVSRGNQVEHWLNGYRVLAYERGGAAFREGYLQSKYNDPNFTKNGKWGLTEEGRILLQDHCDSKVYFRNIKVRRLK